MSNQPEKGVDLAHPPLSPPPFFLHLSQNQQYRCSTRVYPALQTRLLPAFPQVHKFFWPTLVLFKITEENQHTFFNNPYFCPLFISIYLFNLLIFFSILFYVIPYVFLFLCILIYLYFLLYSILIKSDVNCFHTFSYIFMFYVYVFEIINYNKKAIFLKKL